MINDDDIYIVLVLTYTKVEPDFYFEKLSWYLKI